MLRKSCIFCRYYCDHKGACMSDVETLFFILGCVGAAEGFCETWATIEAGF